MVSGSLPKYASGRSVAAMWLHFYNLALLTKLSHPPILSFFRIFELETSVNCDKGREGAAFKISLYNICCRLPSGSIL